MLTTTMATMTWTVFDAKRFASLSPCTRFAQRRTQNFTGFEWIREFSKKGWTGGFWYGSSQWGTPVENRGWDRMLVFIVHFVTFSCRNVMILWGATEPGQYFFRGARRQWFCDASMTYPVGSPGSVNSPRWTKLGYYLVTFKDYSSLIFVFNLLAVKLTAQAVHFHISFCLCRLFVRKGWS